MVRSGVPSRGEEQDFLLLLYLLVTKASNVDEFIRFPSEELLELCTKEQLLKIADHYQVEISDKCQILFS